MSDVLEQFVWAEKYRPTKIAECILPKATKDTAEDFISQGRLPTLMFTGGAGMGKTTLAKAMCNEIGADWIIVNASSDNGIGTLRVRIANFASTVSFSNAKKVVILDEADALTPQFQAACRNFFEEFAHNCTFILTCNFKNKIIEPIHSRCAVIDFKIPNQEKPKLASEFYKRVTDILHKENVEFDKKVVAELVQRHFPDFRRCLNELQRYSAGGKIDAGILLDVGEESMTELFKALKDKKFNDMRKWCTHNADSDSSRIFRMIYDKASEVMAPKSLPQLIILIGEYMHRATSIGDQEINMAAFLTEVMASVEWK